MTGPPSGKSPWAWRFERFGRWNLAPQPRLSPLGLEFNEPCSFRTDGEAYSLYLIHLYSLKVDLNLLRVLLAIDDTGNVSTAAERLGVSQPAASAALGRLRKAFGDPLFIRHGLRMRPTPLAQSLVAKSREVIDVIDREILVLPVFDAATHSGEITLCLSGIGEVVLLPALYHHLRQAAPGVRLNSISLPPGQLEAAMHDGSVHLAIGYFPDLAGNDMFQQRLFSHELACLIGKRHSFKGKRLTLEQFSQMEHLLVRDGSRTLEMYEQYVLDHRIARRISLRMSHHMSVPGLVESSELMVVLPRTLAERFTRHWDVRVIAPPREIPGYDLKQYWHRRYANDPANQWLRQAVAQLFNDRFL